jgi:lipoprotein-releasing system permease protein
VYRSFLALRYVRTRFVNLISIGGVMVGVAVLIVVTGVMDGFQERVRDVLRGNLSHLQLMPRAAEWSARQELGTFSRELRASDPRIVGVAPQVWVPMGYFNESRGMRVMERSLEMMTGVGLDWETEKAIEAELERSAGARATRGSIRVVVANDPKDPFESPRTRQAMGLGEGFEKYPVMVSRAFVYQFRIPLRPADRPKAGSPEDLAFLRTMLENDAQVELLLPGRDATGRPTAEHYSRGLVISAVYDGGDQSMDITRFFFRRPDLVRIAKLKEPFQELRVWLRDYEDAPTVKREIMERHPDVIAVTWEDQREDFLAAVRTERVLLVIVLSFIVLLSGFIILATLTLTVVEKTRDIGVLGALGASRNGILSIFLRNGFFIGVIGALLGLGLGALLVDNLNAIKEFFDRRGIHLFPPNIYLFTEIPTIWDWPTVLTIMGGSVAMSFFAGLLPALRASRLDPVVALRHE